MVRLRNPWGEGEWLGLEILHDQPAGMFFEVDIKCLILDEIPMPEVFDKQKVALEIR